MANYSAYATNLLRDIEKKKKDENSYGGAYQSDLYALSGGAYGTKSERNAYGGYVEPLQGKTASSAGGTAGLISGILNSPMPQMQDTSAVVQELLTGGGQKPLKTEQEISASSPTGPAADVLKSAYDMLDTGDEEDDADSEEIQSESVKVNPLESLIGGPLPFSPINGIKRSDSGGKNEQDNPGPDNPADKTDEDPIRSLLDSAGVSRNIEDVLGQYAANTGGRASSAAVSAAAKSGQDAISKLLNSTGGTTAEQLSSLIGGDSGNSSGDDWKYWAEDYVTDIISNDEEFRKYMSLTNQGLKIDSGRLIYDLKSQFPNDYLEKFVSIILLLEDEGAITAADREQIMSEAGIT